MGMGTPMNALEEIYHSSGGSGIVLRVLRPAPETGVGTQEIAGTVPDTEVGMSPAILMSDQYAQLTVAGVVDYVGTRRERPIISRLPNVPTVSGNPLVWLMRDGRGSGHRCIVQSDENGGPFLGSVRPGGNYAISSDVNFGRMVGDNYGAIPIFDMPGKSDDRTTWGQ